VIGSVARDLKLLHKEYEFLEFATTFYFQYCIWIFFKHASFKVKNVRVIIYNSLGINNYFSTPDFT